MFSLWEGQVARLDRAAARLEEMRLTEPAANESHQRPIVNFVNPFFAQGPGENDGFPRLRPIRTFENFVAARVIVNFAPAAGSLRRRRASGIRRRPPLLGRINMEDRRCGG
jgi:hypothetical protein